MQISLEADYLFPILDEHFYCLNLSGLVPLRSKISLYKGDVGPPTFYQNVWTPPASMCHAFHLLTSCCCCSRTERWTVSASEERRAFRKPTSTMDSTYHRCAWFESQRPKKNTCRSVPNRALTQELKHIKSASQTRRWPELKTTLIVNNIVLY